MGKRKADLDFIKELHRSKRKVVPVKLKLLLASAVIIYGLTVTGGNVIYVEAAEEVKTEQNADAEQNLETSQNAVEITELSQIMVAEETVDMKAEPNANAGTLMTYEKGALVFATGETADGWYRVTYQDKEGYVEKTALRMQEIDVEGLNAEMAVTAEEAKLVVETVEKYRDDARRSKIWGSVIVTLVAGIFAVGIISAVGTKKNKNDEDDKEEQLKIEDLDLENE